MLASAVNIPPLLDFHNFCNKGLTDSQFFHHHSVVVYLFILLLSNGSMQIVVHFHEGVCQLNYYTFLQTNIKLDALVVM